MNLCHSKRSFGKHGPLSSLRMFIHSIATMYGYPSDFYRNGIQNPEGGTCKQRWPIVCCFGWTLIFSYNHVCHGVRSVSFSSFTIIGDTLATSIDIDVPAVYLHTTSKWVASKTPGPFNGYLYILHRLKNPNLRCIIFNTRSFMIYQNSSTEKIFRDSFVPEPNSREFSSLGIAPYWYLT